MNQEELQKLIDIRTYAIECHNSLDPNAGDYAVVKQSDVAHDLTQIIAKLDNILRQHVSFE